MIAKKDDENMKSYITLTILLCVIMVFSPLITLAVKSKSNTTENEPLTSAVSKDETKKDAEKNAGQTIKVSDVSSSKVIEIEIYDYVLGVMASEMPVSFHEEALKAQAVASYTYALWVKENSDNPENELYDITNSSAIHQSFKTQEELKEKWGEKYNEYIAVYKNALNAVSGQYLTYQNETILAVYHAISSGTTESAKTVWKGDLPYLKSVNAIGDTLSPDFDSEKSFTKEEFLLLLKENAVNTEKDGVVEFSHIQSENSFYIKELTLNDKTFTGAEIMGIFSLPSPNFTLSYSNETYVFSCKGKGHGIGMSQYSADYMARQGSSYKDILEHFYKGATLKK